LNQILYNTTECPRKTWWDCMKENVKSLGLSQEDAQSENMWRRKHKETTV